MLCSPLFATSSLSTPPEEVHDSLRGSAAPFVSSVVGPFVGVRESLVVLVKDPATLSTAAAARPSKVSDSEKSPW